MSARAWGEQELKTTLIKHKFVSLQDIIKEDK